MSQRLPIDKVLTDPRLLASQLGDIGTWLTWFAIFKAAFVIPLGPEEREVFNAIAGNRPLPKKRIRELWVCAGRRSGKSRMAALLAVYFSLFQQYRLSPGERAMVLVLAASMDQAKVVFGYTLAFLQNSEVLRREIESSTTSEIRLKNGIVIAVHSNSFRSVRGRTLCACILDECAFFRSEDSAVSDMETYSAVIPSLLTTNGILVGISSPYRRLGLLYTKHKRYFGTDSDDTLFVQGSSLQFNRTLDADAIQAQREADPTAARSEWDGEYRDEISGFLDDALIDRAIDRGRPLELPPKAGIHYRAYVDPSGGAAGGDAYALAIAHKDGGRYVIDVVRGRRGPADPSEITKEYAELCKQYHIHSVVGDAYSAEWCSSAWRREGITYIQSELNASELYIEALPAFTRGLVSIPDHAVLLRELRLLERSPTRMGKEQVTHPRGVHDDHANVVCAVLHNLSSGVGYDLETLRRAFALDDDDTNKRPRLRLVGNHWEPV
jgi:Terminase large subunit, T4likevirus-type, N-terminal